MIGGWTGRTLAIAGMVWCSVVKAGVPAQGEVFDPSGPFVQYSIDVDEQPLVTFEQGDSVRSENKRWVGAVLALFLGPFGAHRLYLGTTAKVPIVYGLTFGGFGVLALIDLGHILFTKDLSRFEHSDRVFMWARPKAATTPP